MTQAIACNKDTVPSAAVQAPTAAAPLTTTLYDVVAAVQDLLGPEQDDMVVATVMALLQSGHVTRSRVDTALWPLTRAS